LHITSYVTSLKTLVWLKRLFVRDSSSPDGESESQLVDQIRDVVRDVDDTLFMVGSGGSKESQVVSERVDGPSDGDDQSERVESGLAGLVAGSSADLRALTSEHFIAESQPAEAPRNESAEDGDNSRLTSVSACQHKNGLSQQSVEESGAQVWHNSLQDQVELDDLERDGDKPISVSVDGRRGLSQNPRLTHVAVVPEGNTGDETSNCYRRAPLLWDGCAFAEEEDRSSKHRSASNPERCSDDIMASKDVIILHSLHDWNAGSREREPIRVARRDSSEFLYSRHV